MFKLISSLLTTLFVISSFALVDMSNKQFSQEWFDLENFPATREYKENTSGIFGKNWCSILDTQKSKCSHKASPNQELKFTIVKNKVIKVSSTKNKKIWIIKYNSQGLVAEITNSTGKALASFTYNKTNQPAQATTQWQTIYGYEYNTAGYLTKGLYPDNTTIQINYNSNNQVTSFIDRDRCTEKYEYTGDNPETKKTANYTSSVTKTCENEVVAQKTYEFWQAPSKTLKKTTIVRVKTTTNNQIQDVTYNDNQKPISITRDKQASTYEYYKNGSVKSKITNQGRLDYTHNKENKVETVTQSLVNTQGKITESFTTTFKYNKGLLVSAKNSGGESVKLTYDDQGQISSITNKTNQTVLLEYDEVLKKPSLVTIKGEGKLQLTYGVDGLIKKVHSPQGTEVAVKVSYLLNKLLDVIRPANEEIY